MHPHLNDASAAFMYTLLSGRCPVVAEPAPSGSIAWRQWLGHKIGYETAWQMSHLSARAPGFRVLASATTATTISPTTTETMTVQFAYPPQADVTVTVTVSTLSPTAAIVSPKTLVFTPVNYNTPRQVKVAGIPGATASAVFNVVYSTISNDEIFNGLGDSWSYTNTRSATAGLTQVDNGSSTVLVAQNTTKVINLGVASANAGNTVLAGPFHGSIIWQGNGVIEYTPVTGYTGTDQIVFAVTNGTTQTIGTTDISIEIPEGQVSVNATDASASEEGQDNGTYVISRLGDTGSPVNVLYSLSGAAALADDYTLSHTSPVTIPAGQSSVTLTLTPVDDSTFGEGNESAMLTIIADAAYPIGMNYWANDYAPAITTNFVAGAANIMNYVWTSGASKQILANGKIEGSNASAGVIAASEPQPYSSWIGGFTGLGGLTACDDDADGDGIKNGVEAFFGTAPNAPNAGLSAVALNGNPLTFTHPEADPPLTDVTGSYEWSLDLSAWNGSGDEVIGMTVTIGATRNSPQSGTATVAAIVTGTQPGKVFVRAVATRN